MNALALRAKTSWTVGEPHLGLDGRPLKGNRKETYCSFSTDVRAVDSLEADVREFLGGLGSRQIQLEALHRSGGRFALYVMWTCRHPPGFEFDVELLKRMTELGIELWLEAV